MKWLLCFCGLCFLGSPFAWAQSAWIEGQVRDANSGEALPGANVVLVELGQGTTTDGNGMFRLGPVTPGRYTLQVSFVGYQTLVRSIAVGDASLQLELNLNPALFEAEAVVVTGSRQTEKLLEAPVTIETITAADLARTGGGTFLSALAGLKGIDFVDAGINAQGISARGFNSQFNTRMLAMIDGRVAQLPGTGLPQGNFLPTAPLDIKAIEVVVGPASALYGPNAHTGVVNVITKDPWDASGLALAARTGERSLVDVTGRAAGTVGSWGWKVTGQYMEADDFEPSREEGLHNYGTSIYEGDVLRDIGGYHIRSAKLEGFLYYRMGAWMAKGGAGYSTNDNFGLTNNGRNHIRGWEVQYQTVEVSHPNWYAQFTRTKNEAGKTYQLNAVVQAAAQVMGGTPLEQVDLVGLSMGGQIALTMALQHPERIRRLVLAAPAGIETFAPEAAAQLKALFTAEAIASMPPALYAQNVQRNFAHWEPERYGWLLEQRAQLQQRPDFHAYAEANARAVAGMLDEPVYDRLPEVKHPALVLFGKEDQLIPNRFFRPEETPAEVLRQALERLPDARGVLLPSAGHLLVLEQPEAVVEQVRRFLR